MTGDTPRRDIAQLADAYWSFHRNTAQSWNIDRGDVEQIEHWEDLSSEGTRARIEALGHFAESRGA